MTVTLDQKTQLELEAVAERIVLTAEVKDGSVEWLEWNSFVLDGEFENIAKDMLGFETLPDALIGEIDDYIEAKIFCRTVEH